MMAHNESVATIRKKDESNTYILLGRDIATIPCLRNSFLYGISGGIGGGLLAFLFTSRPKTAMNTSVAVYFNITIGYWFYCRYNRFIDKYKTIKIQDSINEIPKHEDTDKEPLFKEEQSLVDV